MTEEHPNRWDIHEEVIERERVITGYIKENRVLMGKRGGLREGEGTFKKKLGRTAKRE